MQYLPPYSPGFNPIEKPFAGLKMWMQKNRDLVIAFGVGFRGLLFTHWRFVQTMLLRTLKLVTLRFNSYYSILSSLSDECSNTATKPST